MQLPVLHYVDPGSDPFKILLQQTKNTTPPAVNYDGPADAYTDPSAYYIVLIPNMPTIYGIHYTESTGPV